LIRILEYLDRRGRSLYAEWLDSLQHEAAAKVVEAVFRMSQGNHSNIKAVGAGVLERKVNFGPGYRIYFGRDGDRLVVLLGGSSKQDQQKAIEAARGHWRDYRARKR
jgi:putative addiction module killer protein